MSPRKMLATSERVLHQLRHDPRTIAIILVVPCVLLTILKYMFDNKPQIFASVAPMTLGIFPLFMMFLVTSIATLRERRSGTMERLLTMPISKGELIGGYAIAFSLVGFLQACVASAMALGVLRVQVMGGTFPVLVAAIAAALLGTALGLCVSAVATSEFQAIEMIMPVLIPQILLCGLFVQRPDLVAGLRWLSDVMPLSYSVDAMIQVTRHTGWPSYLIRDLIIVTICGIVALAVGSLTIRRQSS